MATNAGLYHGHGHAVSSQSIIRHDAGYAPLVHAAPVPHYAGYYAAPTHDTYVCSERKLRLISYILLFNYQ